MLSGGTHTPHKLQGIGAGIIPENFHAAAVDGYIQVSEEDAFSLRRSLREGGGHLPRTVVGRGAGGGREKVAGDSRGSRVLTFNYDTGERYLSVEGLFPGGAYNAFLIAASMFWSPPTPV